MIRLLIANVKANGRPRIHIMVGGNDEFDPNVDTIYINPSGYDATTGITLSPLCGIDRKGALVEKYDTIGEALFHELCHAFHWVS
jgi:hypothetical protein